MRVLYIFDIVGINQAGIDNSKRGGIFHLVSMCKGGVGTTRCRAEPLTGFLHVKFQCRVSKFSVKKNNFTGFFTDALPLQLNLKS
jgi:hypothetical protein